MFYHHLSPTAADNILTWDRAILVAAMVMGFEVDFFGLLLAIIDERVFKASTTYLFPCITFVLCRDAGLPILHIDVLWTPTRIVDIILIKDEANEAAPNWGS